MRLLDLIGRKRDGGEHPPAELDFLAAAACDPKIPDYQLSAWLMAVRLNGMSPAETTALTRAMARSGASLSFQGVRAPKADKHSTGGVGDGVSLVLAPLVAAAGVAVPMMSGRGLGHTGGTLDKLESIPGFQVRLPPPRVRGQLASIGVCMFGQSGALAPADRRLYALRDATGTTESLPLIVSSILSKKLAEGLDALVLDVKCGSGAFLRGPGEALALARGLTGTARRLGLRCAALVTDMEQPLGLAVGNALELRQAVAMLRGDPGPADFRELTLALGGWMLRLAGEARGWEEGRERLEALLRDGGALAKFRRMVRSQGGDPRVADEPDRVLPRAPCSAPLRARRSGYLARLDALETGRAAVLLGAGRSRMEDAVDPSAGVVFRFKPGARVRAGEELARLYAADPAALRRGLALLAGAVGFADRPPRPRPVVLKVIP